MIRRELTVSMESKIGQPAYGNVTAFIAAKADLEATDNMQECALELLEECRKVLVAELAPIALAQYQLSKKVDANTFEVLAKRAPAILQMGAMESAIDWKAAAEGEIPNVMDILKNGLVSKFHYEEIEEPA